MNPLNPITSEYVIKLVELVGHSDAWGTELGAKVFGELNQVLLPLNQNSRVVMDYHGLNRSDASFQREAVVETLRKHRPRLLFVATHLEDPDLRANLELALEKRGDVLLVRERDGHLSVLGKQLPIEHRGTLAIVTQTRGEFTSGRLTTKPYNLEPSTASARLTALWRAGLIERVQGAAAGGGREYRYFAIR
jgi:hypothetical protein